MAVLPKRTATKFTNNQTPTYTQSTYGSVITGNLGTYAGKQVIALRESKSTMTQTVEYSDGSTETLSYPNTLSVTYASNPIPVTTVAGQTTMIPGPLSATINGPVRAGAGWGTAVGYTSAQSGYTPYQMTFDEVMKEAPKPKTHREILDIELSKLNVPFSSIELLETFDSGEGKDLNNPVYGFACEYCALVVEGFHNIHFTAKAFANHWKTCDER